MTAAVSNNKASPARWSLSTQDRPPKPLPRITVFGEPGIGKTSFGVSAPNVVLIPTEDGALGTPVPRLPTEGRCQTWDDVLHAARLLLTEQHGYRWVVIDTINAAENMCSEMVCARDFNGNWNTRKGVEGFNAFGKGEKAAAQELRGLLSILDGLQQKRGMGVILLAHVGLHKQANMLGPDFSKFGGDMGKHAWSLVCSWSDQVGYACREFRASTREGERHAKAHAIGSERWLVFEGGPALDAKARVGYEMPERILLSWEEYERMLGADRVASLVAQAMELLATSPARDKVAAKLGGQITDFSVRALGKTKLETLIGWLMAQQRAEKKDEA